MAQRYVSQRSRGWCFTVNNYEEGDLERLLRVPCRYVVIGRERAPSTNTPHLQGYIRYETIQRFEFVRRQLGQRAHIEPQHGPTEAAIQYCKKEGLYEERGSPPLPQEEARRRGGEATRERWAAARKACEEGRFDAVPDDIYIRHYPNCKAIRSEKAQCHGLARLEEPAGRLYYGVSGSGKSWAARERYPEAYIKNANKWWDGYQGQSAVILDDLEPKLAQALSYHIKIWLDIYPFNAEIKHGSLFIRPKDFIITTQYSIEQLWPDDDETQAAIRRRCPVREHFNRRQ